MSNRSFADLGGPEMTFQEIADELGVSKQRAQQIFYAGISKLRRKRARMTVLVSLASELQRERYARLAPAGQGSYRSEEVRRRTR
jgi:serine phosphatase RsbU (regulator of sigma subunit)